MKAPFNNVDNMVQRAAQCRELAGMLQHGGAKQTLLVMAEEAEAELKRMLRRPRNSR